MLQEQTNARQKAQRIYAKYDRSTRNPTALVLEANEGVLATAFFDVVELAAYRKDQLAEVLHVSLKTLQRYREENKKLSPASSEQVLKLIALFRKGEEVFGELEAFKRWLEKPAYGLGDQIPFLFLQTSGGIDLIAEELSRIAYGDLA